MIKCQNVVEILTGETRAFVVVAAAAVSSLRESERQRRRPEGRREGAGMRALCQN